MEGVHLLQFDPYILIGKILWYYNPMYQSYVHAYGIRTAYGHDDGHVAMFATFQLVEMIDGRLRSLCSWDFTFVLCLQFDLNFIYIY